MKKVNFDSVEESSGGNTPLDPGPYVAVITGAIDHDDKEYVELVFDIAEGPRKGYYSDEWAAQHVYAHHIILSYKDSALGFLKHNLKQFTESNAGFDAEAAWNGGKLDMFTGKLVGINLRQEEYEKDGEVKLRFALPNLCPAQDVRDGKVKPLPTKTLGGVRPSTTANADIPIPF